MKSFQYSIYSILSLIILRQFHFCFIKVINRLFAFLIISSVYAINDTKYILTTANTEQFKLADTIQSAHLLISTYDYAGVILALNNLNIDLGKVTGHEPEIINRSFANHKDGMWLMKSYLMMVAIETANFIKSLVKIL